MNAVKAIHHDPAPAHGDADAMDALFSGVPDLIAFKLIRHHDARRELVWVSDTIETVLGIERDAAMADFGVWLDAIDPDDQPRILEAETRALRTGERVALDVSASVRGEWRTMRMSLHPTPLEKRAVLWNGLMRDVSEERARNAERDRLAAIIETTEDFAGIAKADATNEYINPAARRMLKLPEGFDEATLSIDQCHPPDTVERIMTEAFPAIIQGMQWTGDLELRDFDGAVRPVNAMIMGHHDPAGTLTHVSSIMRDISDRTRMERELRLVNRELNHRIKNLFSVMQALVTMSARGERDAGALATKLKSRMDALSAAHLMSTELELGRTALRPVALDDLLTSILKPYEREAKQLTMEGPPILLPHKVLTPIGLIVHELATNAVKYGAWTDDDGVIDVRWSFEAGGGGDGSDSRDGGEGDERTVRLEWSEASPQAGTPHASPTHAGAMDGNAETARDGVHLGRGFGSRLIAMSAQQLHGGVEQVWRDGSLATLVRIVVPVVEKDVDGEDGVPDAFVPRGGARA